MEKLPREFYRLDELAQEMRRTTVGAVLNCAAEIGMTVSRLFKGKIIGCIGNIFDPSDFDRIATSELLKTLSYGKQPFYVGYARLRKDEVIDAALRNDPCEKFATMGIVNDKGEIILLPEENFYSNNDLFILRGEVDRIKAEFPELFNQESPGSSIQQQNLIAYPEGEKISGFKGIGRFFGVTDRTAKSYAENVSFPIHKTLTGRVYAFESELKQWKENFDREKPKRKKDKLRKREVAIKTRKKKEETLYYPKNSLS